ncbi:MAG: GIY-YIG nuclease family protein [Anaerolineales bacterium]|nr:GIY-YIG nuclease family protein [Anaerolineales bacterium]
MAASSHPFVFDFPSAGGLYLLLFGLTEPSKLDIGRLGSFHFRPGSYAYIGSARGPGGLAARLARHLRPAQHKRPHWHIDHLLNKASIQGVGWSFEGELCECGWAAALSALGVRRPRRFGSSDCRCAGHLIEFQPQTTIQRVLRTIPAELHFRLVGTAI